jgi:hypothetical protein
MTETRSAESVARLRSMMAGSGVRVVEPWPRASRDRMPAVGSFLRISAVRAAKERPEEPPPWCVTKRGAVPMGEVR